MELNIDLDARYFATLRKQVTDEICAPKGQPIDNSCVNAANVLFLLETIDRLQKRNLANNSENVGLSYDDGYHDGWDDRVMNFGCEQAPKAFAVVNRDHGFLVDLKPYPPTNIGTDQAVINLFSVDQFAYAANSFGTESL